MYIRIDDADARTRVIAYLREQDYLAAEEAGRVSALPLNSVSDRYDCAALGRLLRTWGASDGRTVNGRVMSHEELKWLALQRESPSLRGARRR